MVFAFDLDLTSICLILTLDSILASLGLGLDNGGLDYSPEYRYTY